MEWMFLGDFCRFFFWTLGALSEVKFFTRFLRESFFFLLDLKSESIGLEVSVVRSGESCGEGLFERDDSTRTFRLLRTPEERDLRWLRTEAVEMGLASSGDSAGERGEGVKTSPLERGDSWMRLEMLVGRESIESGTIVETWLERRGEIGSSAGGVRDRCGSVPVLGVVSSEDSAMRVDTLVDAVSEAR